MTRLVHAELRKYLTTRLAWSMPLTMFLLGGIFAAVQGLVLVLLGEIPTGAGGEVIRPSELFDDLTLARMVYTGAVQMGYLLALVLGILTMSGEFRHKTITATLLSSPRRGRCAKCDSSRPPTVSNSSSGKRVPKVELKSAISVCARTR